MPLYIIKDDFGVFPVMIVKFLIPSFLTGYLLYGHIKVLYETFGLLNQEDVT